jgi:hypothetical protein
MTWTIYALCEPSTGEIRYVGKTNNLAERAAIGRRHASSAPVNPPTSQCR